MKVALQPTIAIARFTALEALRTRFAWLVLAVACAGIGIAVFTGALAITETGQTQAVILASVLRLSAVLLIMLFVTTSVSRDFSDKSVELMLSLPIPRAGYFLGKLLGYSFVAVLSTVPLICLMLFFAPAASTVGWGFSLVLELLLVCCFSLLFAFAFGQITASIAATLLVYLLARSISAIQLMANGPLADPGALSHQFLTRLIDVIAYLLPDLARFTRSDWLIYGNAGIDAIGSITTQTVIYLMLLSSVALFDLYRKNF